MGLTFEQQLNILSKGVETVVHDCNLTKIIHYHFVGAPFRGLVSHDIQKKRDEKKIQDNLVKHPKVNQTPLKVSFNDEEGWKMVYELAELSIAETFVVEEVLKKQRVFLTSRVVDDPFDPNPHFEYIDREIAFGEENCRLRQELAKHRNKLIHALNGNIHQVGDSYRSDGNIYYWDEQTIKRLILQQYNKCVGNRKSNEEIDYVSLLNMLDMDENKKITSNFEMTTMTVGMVSIMIRDERVFATGRANCKKKVKIDASHNLLKKLMSTYCFNLNTNLSMKMLNIFPIEGIPKMQSTFKEDTKRNSKTVKHDNSQRSIVLQNKGHEKYAKNCAKKEDLRRLNKIYAIQRKQEKVKVDKIIAQLQTSYGVAKLEWKIPVSVNFGDFQEFLNTAENFFSDEVKKYIDWTSAMNCVYLIYSNPDLLVKWNACDNLRRILGIKTMSVALFASLIIHVFKQVGFVKVDPELQSGLHPKFQTFEPSSTLSILITLILTILYRNNPKASTVEVLVNSCKDLPLATRGVALLEEVVKRVCNYVKGVESLDSIIPNKMEKIEKDVERLSSKKGILLLTTDEKTFVEICQLRLDVVNLSSMIDSRSVYYQKFLVLKGCVNNMYTIAQRSPVAGCGRRKRPVVFHIWGDAGIGKSRIINLVSADTISTILELEGYTEEGMNEALEAYDQFVYYRPVGVQYEQNFISSRAKIYVCDDANQVDAKYLQHGTPFPQAMIHLNNEHDHMLPVAELEMKAQALFKSALIIATDNKQTPDLSYLQCPEAYHRRIDFSFKMVLKEEFSYLHNGTRMVNVAKLDLTQPNEYIYEFHSGGKIYTYENIIALIRNELKSVHTRFKEETIVYKERALITREKMKDTVEEQAPSYIADNAQNTVKPGIIRQFTQKFRERALRESMLYPPPSANVKCEFSELNEMRTQGNPFSHFPYFSEPAVPRERRHRIFFKWVFSWFPLTWTIWLNGFFFGRTEEDKRNRRIALTSVAFILTSFAVYKLYRKFFPPQKKKKSKISTNITERENLEKKKQQIENEIQNLDTADEQKYNDGQPKSVKAKDKTPSDKPVVVVPIFKQMGPIVNENVTKVDVLDYVNSADNQLSCPLAYKTEKMILQNMYILVLEFKRQGQYHYGVLRGTFLNNRTLITNRHFLTVSEEEYKTATISLFNPYKEYLRIPTTTISVVSFAHDDEVDSLYYDLIAITFSDGMKCHIDLTMRTTEEYNFIKMEDMDKMLHQNITMVSLCESVEFEKIDGIDTISKNTSWLLTAEKQRLTVKSINKKPLPASDPDGELLYTWKTLSYDAQTLPGSCGSMLVSNSSNEAGKIVGIHMAGYCYTDDSFGQLITCEMIQALKPLCQMAYKPGHYQTILPNSFPIIDTISRPLHMPSKTKLRHALCFEEIYPTTKAPAKLKYGKNEEHGASIAIKKYLNPSYYLSEEDSAICRAFMYYHFKPARKVKKMSREIAIRGIPGNEYIQAINRNSSAGYPLAMETKMVGKQEFLGKDENFIFDHPRLMQLLDEIQTAILNDTRPEIYFSVTMKDELRKTDKLLARIFAAGPVQYTILFREYFIDFFASLMEGRILNTSLIGINMLSSDVDVLVKYLLEVAHPSDCAFIAGDFRNFDGTLMSSLLWEVYTMIETFYDRYSKTTKALWLEITDSRQIFGNAVAHVASGQPSGNPATTFVNTMYNTSLLYLVITKILLKIGTMEAYEIRADLTKHFRVVTYGDDNIMSFSKVLKKLIKPIEITKTMTTLGHTYTNDAKDGKELEYKLLSEVSILKRTFSYDRMHGWIAPLELPSILECLNWDKVDIRKREEKRAQTIVNMRVAIRELSLHTQDIFEKYRQLILNSAEKHGLRLPPECRFSQSDLRNMTRNGDNLFYFYDDFSILVDHKLRQSFYSERDENMFLTIQDLWPRLETKQRSATEQNNENQSNEVTNQQIVTYDNETTFLEEKIPAQKSLSEEKLYQFEEIRDHGVRDIISRVYNITTVTVPTGGLPGDLLYTFDPLTTLLSQTNVRAKLSKFAAIKANIVIRVLITTARTCSGAVMPQYIPPLGTQRSSTLLQQSQSLRQVVPLSTGGQVDITAPWVDAFLARNLTTTTGSLGTFRITRVTPSQIDSFKIKIQIFCPIETLRVEYPTFIDQSARVSDLKVEKERLEQLIERMEARPTISFVPIARLQMNSLRNIVQKLTSMAPTHNPSNAPITAVKWQPGMGLLNDQAEVPMHNLTVNKQQCVETADGQFGSSIDEMDVERIMNSENIIGVFPIVTSDAVHTVLYARPCTITDFIGTTTGTPAITTMTISHQTFVASLAQEWSAKLHFKICGTHNQLHSYQLRSVFVPEDVGKYTVGQIMSTDDVNAVKGQIHKFGADKMMGEHIVEPMLTTNMKNVPSPRNAAGAISLANYTANQFTHECSYGMFYILIEVPLIAAAQVAPTVYLYIDFFASDVILSEAETWLHLIPQTQMKGIEGESFEQNKDKSKSTIIERGEFSQTVGRMPNQGSTISQSLGEKIFNLKQLASAATVFSNSFSNTALQAFLISPFIFRTTSSQSSLDVGQYNDHIDYLFSAFAFFKGGMIISMGKRGVDQTPFGEMMLINSRNNFTGASLGGANGIVTIPAPNSFSSSARVQPIYSEECIPHVNIPYLQPFNINRTTITIDGFNNGTNRKHLLLRPYTATNVRFFRSAAKDFRLGFLTSLPQYTLNVAATVFT